jgi:hypothetical protein
LNEEVWIVGRGKEGAVVISFPAMTVFAMMLNSIRTWSYFIYSQQETTYTELDTRKMLDATNGFFNIKCVNSAY